MAKVSTKTLLNDNRVVEEINKHLWIESEKAGRDIGFDKAAEDWIDRYSQEWMKHNRPDQKSMTRMTKAKPKRMK